MYVYYSRHCADAKYSINPATTVLPSIMYDLNFYAFAKVFPVCVLGAPIIVISPPPAILVDQTYTFIINCTAMGIPAPEIVWRLNWGHVPDKCRMSNSVQDGNRAYGELTCPNALPSDSGEESGGKVVFHPQNNI